MDDCMNKHIGLISASEPKATKTLVSDKPVISFCLPVYNQSEMVKEALNKIIAYRGDNIEIVVCDDQSTENIHKIVDGIGDSRIKYYRNDENLGHDLNIIKCFRVSNAPFCFLLRVRDRIVPSGIEPMIKRIRENPKIAYLTGNAVDENGNSRLLYHRKRYRMGMEAMAAHDNLYFHPSGSLYAVSLLDLDRAEGFIRSLEDTRHSFLVHSMFRAELACKGDFEIVDDTIIWQYTNTLNSKDVAVNSAERKESVFSPRFMRMRYAAEVIWTSIAVDNSYRLHEYKQLYKRYLDLVTWGCKRRNEEDNLRKHYNFEDDNINISAERNEFNNLVAQTMRRVDLRISEKEELIVTQRRELFLNTTYGKVKFYFSKILRNTIIHKLYKKYNVLRGRT